MIDLLPRVLKNHRTCCDPSLGLRKKNQKNQVMEPTLNCQLFAGSLMKPFVAAFVCALQTILS
jgi:hypothetical protein